ICLQPLACTAVLGGAGEDDSDSSIPPGVFVPGLDVDRSEPFTGPIVSEPGKSVRFYRLNHDQYDRTVRDLLRSDGALELSQLFVAEPLITTFDTDATLLSVSADL